MYNILITKEKAGATLNIYCPLVLRLQVIFMSLCISVFNSNRRKDGCEREKGGRAREGKRKERGVSQAKATFDHNHTFRKKQRRLLGEQRRDLLPIFTPSRKKSVLIK